MKCRLSIFSFRSLLIMMIALAASETYAGNRSYGIELASRPKIVSLANIMSTAVSHDVGGEVERSKDHHPEVKLFGRPIGVLAQFGVMVFNFLIFFGILFLSLRGLLSFSLKSQKEKLKDRLLKSEKDKEEARRQVNELEVRMSNLQQELDDVMTKAEIDANSEQSRILENARTEVAQIMSQTYAEIESLKHGAKAELHAMVMELVVANTTKRLTTQLHGDLAAHALDCAIEKVRGNK